MIARIIPTALRKRIGLDDAPDPGLDGAGEPPPMDFPPVEPLRPPLAQNDDPDRPLLAAIEEDLRTAGYLS
ncbi:hypothetical protein [Methylobacterium sp. JK268]